MILHQVHTITGPWKSYGSYPDPVLAQHMRDHLAEVLHRELAVDEVDEVDDEPATPSGAAR